MRSSLENDTLQEIKIRKEDGSSSNFHHSKNTSCVIAIKDKLKLVVGSNNACKLYLNLNELDKNINLTDVICNPVNWYKKSFVVCTARTISVVKSIEIIFAKSSASFIHKKRGIRNLYIDQIPKSNLTKFISNDHFRLGSHVDRMFLNVINLNVIDICALFDKLVMNCGAETIGELGLALPFDSTPTSLRDRVQCAPSGKISVLRYFYRK